MALATLNTIIRFIDLTMGLVGLVLIVRVVLHLFNVPRTQPFMKAVCWTTDPILNWLNEKLNLSTYTYRLSTRVDVNLISSLAALIILWGTRIVIMWLLNIVTSIVFAFSGGPGGWLVLIRLFVQTLFNAYALAIFLRVIFDWLRLPQSNAIIRWLYTITEPLLAQIRQLVPIVAGFDISPIVAIFFIQFLRGIAISIVDWIF